MPNDRSKQRFRGSIKEINYKTQAPSCIDQLKLETGYGYSKDGHKCWTTFKLGTPRPTIKHPLNFHFQGYNPNGDFLCCMSLTELDNFIYELKKWRDDHAEEISELVKANEILQRNKFYSDRILTVLSDHKHSDPPEIIISGVNITEHTIRREKEVILASILNLKNDKNRTWLLKDICTRLDALISQDIDTSDLQKELENHISLYYAKEPSINDYY